MTNKNPYLDFFNINALIVKIYPFGLKILSKKKILTSFKGHNSVINLRIMTGNNCKLDLVNINAYTKFGHNLAIYFKDIEQKQSTDINQGP